MAQLRTRSEHSAQQLTSAASNGTLVPAKDTSQESLTRASQRILGAVRKWMKVRNTKSVTALFEVLRHQHPEESDDTLRGLVREEFDREREFQAKLLERLERDIPRALREGELQEARATKTDQLRRKALVDAVLTRERARVRMREQAMVERALAAAELTSMQRMSPQGAYWMLDDQVKTHTLDCLAVGNAFWPWSVLREVHPPLHHGCPCRLLTLQEATRLGLMTADHLPDPEDAAARFRSAYEHAKGLMEVADQSEIDAYLTHLEEVFVERLHPRDRKGRWRTVVRPHVANAFKLAVPALGTPLQRQARKDGEWHWAGGRRVFVPTARGFNRRIGAHRYTSPPGSPLLYRDGEIARANVERLGDPGVVEPGEPSPGILDRVLGRAKKTHHPIAPVEGPLDLSAPGLSPIASTNWQEFSNETHAIAAALAKRFHAPVVLGGRVVSDADRYDHSGLEDWDGNIYFGADVEPSVLSDARKSAQGQAFTGRDLANTYNTYRVQAHEASHLVYSADPEAYSAPGGQVLEEGLAEDLAHVLLRENLKRHGRTDVLQWEANNPDDEIVKGTYRQYRTAIRKAFDQIGVPPDQREEFAFHLKFGVPPLDRVDAMEAEAKKFKGKDAPSRAAILKTLTDTHEDQAFHSIVGKDEPTLRPGKRDPGDPQSFVATPEEAKAWMDAAPEGAYTAMAYHGTRQSNLPSIQTEGLRSGSNPLWRGTIWLTTNRHNAKWYAEGDKGVVNAAVRLDRPFRGTDAEVANLGGVTGSLPETLRSAGFDGMVLHQDDGSDLIRAFSPNAVRVVHSDGEASPGTVHHALATRLAAGKADPGSGSFVMTPVEAQRWMDAAPKGSWTGTLYHGTGMDSAEAIKQGGFEPRGWAHGTWLAPKREMAERYAHRIYRPGQDEAKGPVLEVAVRAEKPYFLSEHPTYDGAIYSENPYGPAERAGYDAVIDDRGPEAGFSESPYVLLLNPKAARVIHPGGKADPGTPHHDLASKLAGKADPGLYRGIHTAPGPNGDDAPATDLERIVPDFYAHPEWYRTGDDVSDGESIRAIQRIRNKPDQLVWIYRAMPALHVEGGDMGIGSINGGDWVTLSRTYARGHSKHPTDPKQDMLVFAKRVPAKTLWWDANSVNEFGYSGPDIKVAQIIKKGTNPPVANPGTAELPSLASAAPVFDGFEHGGLTAKVDEGDSDSATTDKLTVIEGGIWRGKKNVGNFRRVFGINGRGDLVVDHDIFDLADSEQDKGFATAFNQHAEQEYRRLGVHQINIQTTMVGGYAWARAGYEFQGDGAETAKLLWVSRDAQGWAKDLPDHTLADRLKADIEAGKLTTPLAIAGWGREHSWVLDKPLTINAGEHDQIVVPKGTKLWGGKLFMLGTAWTGVKTL